MSSSVKKEIENIEQFLYVGKYYEALDLLETILEKKEIIKEEKITAKILKSKTLRTLGVFEWRQELYEKALECAEEAFRESKNLENYLLMFDANCQVIWGQWFLSKYNELLKIIEKNEQILATIKLKHPSKLKQRKADMLFWKAISIYAIRDIGGDVPEGYQNAIMQFTKKGLKLYKELDNKEEIARCFQIIGNIYSTRGNYEQALKNYEKAMKVYEEMGNKYWLSFLLIQITDTYWRKGEYDHLLEYLKKAIEIDEELENKYVYGHRQNFLAIYYAEKGDWDQALEHFEKALKLCQENDQKGMVRACLGNIGVVYQIKGELDKALEYQQKAQKIYEEMQYPGPSIHSVNIAWIHYSKGELDEALRISKQNLEALEKYDEKVGIARTLHRISLILWQQGKTKQALEYMQRNLKLREELGNKIQLAYSLGNMITFIVETNQQELAKQHLDRFKSIVDEVRSKPLTLQYRLTEALVLKNSSRHRDRIKAEVLFEQLLEEDLPYSEHIKALLNLCELLLIELQSTNDEAILKKVQKHISRLYDFAEANSSHLLIVETLWLQSQIAMIELDVKKAQELLLEAHKVIEEKGFERLAGKISKEQEKLDKLSSELIEAGKVAYSKRMQLVDVGSTIKEIKKQRMVEEPITGKKLFSLRI